MPILPPVLRAGSEDLPDVPPFVRYLMGAFLAPILAWLETLVLRRMFQHCADHPLVLLAQWYDPAPVVAACAHFYHQEGAGSPPTYSVDQLVRAEIVRSFCSSCSDPELEVQLATNLLLRWFVGLPLVGRTPDHATLNRFHAFLSAQQPDTLFRDVLAFLDRVDPEDPATTAQIVDTFALASPAQATPSVAHLLRQLCLRLALCWQQHAPAHCQHALPPLDLGALARPVHARTALARQRHLHEAVTIADWLSAGLGPALAQLPSDVRTVVASYLTAIAKVQADELVRDASGHVTERPAKERGHYRIASAFDLEATFRKHEGKPAVFGSNAVISTTQSRIRAAVVLTGCSPDAEAPTAVLEQQQAAEQPLPPYLVMDQAGGPGKVRARVAVLSDGQTRLVAWTPKAGGSDPSRLNVADFVHDPLNETCTCPNGVVSHKAYASRDGDGVHFRFLASDCQGCPLWTRCREAEANPKGHRTVFISAYHAHLREAARFNATAEGRSLLAGRWQVEPTIAWLVRYQGCRRARRVGRAAAQCQLFQACALRNLLLWLSRVRRGLATRPAA